MSVHAVHHGSVLVVSVHGNDPHILQRLTIALDDVVRHGESMIIDVSDLTLAPRSSIVPFLEQLSALATRSPAGVVVVADRLSARRVLNRLLRSPSAVTAPSVTAALRVLEDAALPAIPTQAHVVDRERLPNSATAGPTDV